MAKTAKHWFDRLTKDQQKEYIKTHPNSKLAHPIKSKLKKVGKFIGKGLKAMDDAAARDDARWDAGVDYVANKVKGDGKSKVRRGIAKVGTKVFESTRRYVDKAQRSSAAKLGAKNRAKNRLKRIKAAKK